MKKCFQLKANPYGKRILIAVGVSKEHLLQEIKRLRLRKTLYNEIKKEKHLPFKHNNAMTYMDKNYGNAVMYLNKFRYTPKWIALLGHEMNHFCVNVMENVGSNIMKDDEPFCYSQEDLMEKALQRLKKLR